MRGTVAASSATCSRRLRLRYDSAHADDGLPPGEGAFLACTFLARRQLLSSRAGTTKRGELFERLLAIRNDVGLLAEEYDSGARRQVGNFPQAFSHVGLVSTAFNIQRSVVQRRET